MHVNVVKFATPSNVVGGAWDQRRGYSFPIRRQSRDCWSAVIEVKTSE